MTTPWDTALTVSTNVVDMRFGPVRLTVTTDLPLPSDAWSSIGYAARHIESLAEKLEAALAAGDAPVQHEGAPS